MSSSRAARSASAIVHVQVVERLLLHGGAVVKMKIPPGALDETNETEDGDVRVIRFGQAVPGGNVNYFVHVPTDFHGDLRGTTITATATILKKTLDDGRQYLYVDLVPVEGRAPTHRIAVAANVSGSWDSDDHLIFETPAPLRGIIILAPPKAKIVPYA